MSFLNTLISRYWVFIIIIIFLVCIWVLVLIIKDKKRIKKAIEFDAGKSAKILSYQRLIAWGKQKYYPSRCVLVNMELIAGGIRQFIAIETDSGFMYRGKKYLFDNEMKYYNHSAGMNAFDYHEMFSLPIQKKINIHDIKQKLEIEKNVEIEYMVNPATLDRFITSKIAEGVMKGAAIDEFLRQLRIMIIIVLITCIIHLFLFMQKTGMFSKIKMPF